MSLNKAIEHGKEHRIQYGIKKGTYAKLVDTHCRNHGECVWCTNNRTYNTKRRKQKADYKDDYDSIMKLL